MKFKVTPKDFMNFCCYSAILLVLCAIAVLNIDSLLNEGTFYGLLPFMGFAPRYIGYTFGLFIAVLIIIFTGVNSSIFEKEKGGLFGLNIKEKSSEGYSKWANEKEIKGDKGIVKVQADSNDLEAAGVPIINKGKDIWVDNGEYHNLIIGATGSGKTECIVKPMVNLLGKRGESMVITDPKGEIYEYCGEYLREQGYNIVILNFREPEKGNAWNPLTLPYRFYKEGNIDKATELLEDVATNILFDKNNSDPFWDRSAADYFSGLTLALFMDAKEKEVNFNSINYMSTVGEERRGSSTYVKEYFQLHGEDSAPYIFASNTFNAPQDTKGSILSTFRQKIRLFSTRESLSEMLSYSDFDMRDIGNKKTAVFMIIHDEKKTYHALMTIFTKQCYETLVDCATKSGGKLKYRTNFILDEFANMPPLNDVDSMVTAARSRAIRFTFIIQNFSQLDDVYNPEVAQTIKGNCGNLIYLISTELKALEEISKMCGEVKSKDKDKTASTPLITISDLQKLKLFQAIIIRWRKNPFKTDLTPDFKIDWGHKNRKAFLPEREKREVALFDIKAYVSEKKKNEALNNPGMMGGGNPFMGGGMGPTFNPFLNQEPSPVNPFMKEPASGPTFNPFLNQEPQPVNNPIKENPFLKPEPAQDSFNPFIKNETTNNQIINNQTTNNMFPTPNNNPFGDISTDDIDEMVKDIERKLKELDEEEKANELKKKTESEKLPEIKQVANEKLPDYDIAGDEDDSEVIDVKDIIVRMPEEKPEIININETKTYEENELEKALEKIETNEKSEKVSEYHENPLDFTQEIKLDDIIKPKINVDKDSIVLDENIVTDDEFYDDFFDE